MSKSIEIHRAPNTVLSMASALLPHLFWPKALIALKRKQPECQEKNILETAS